LKPSRFKANTARILNIQTGSKAHNTVRLMMNLLDYPLLTQFEQQVNNTTLQLAAQAFLEAVGIKVEVFGSIPQHGATLLIANHPSGIDGMVLFATVSRPDFYQVGLAVHRLMKPAAINRILPVYRNQKPRDFLPNIFAPHLQSHVLDNPIETSTKNHQSIVEAARLVTVGYAVAMYPEGVAGQRPQAGTWKPGIGFLVKEIVNPATQVVFVKIDGTRGIDLLRILHPRLRGLLFSEIHVRVTYAAPLPLFDLIDRHASGKMITTQLADLYAQTFSRAL
jgi:1-acyl-sn-glycerol-3-phosphate acyltransferase